jgi:predicted ATP-grasp superfamily ATP-dependent carboligase
MDKVLILDGRQRSALAAVRSLGRQGIFVAVGEDKHPSLASSSKYCKYKFTYAPPIRQPREFIDSLLQELRTTQYSMLFPMTDITCYLVSEYRDEISKFTHIPMVDRETFSKASEKGELIAICGKLGLPIPRTKLLNKVENVEIISREIEYPVVIKPRRSRYLIESNWINTGVDYAFNPEELKRKIRAYNSKLPLPLLQERILGPGAGAFALLNKGEVRAVFFHKRLREKPPSGGVSVLRESAPVDPVMLDYSVKLLKELKWHGVAMVEFKIDSRDQLPKIMEINGRFWGSLQLAIDAGIDFPYLLYKMTRDGDIPESLNYKVGVQSRWLMGDIDHLLAMMLKSKAALRLPENHPGKLRTLYEFSKFYKSNMRYEVLRPGDIRPFFHEITEWFRNLAKG